MPPFLPDFFTFALTERHYTEKRLFCERRQSCCLLCRQTTIKISERQLQHLPHQLQRLLLNSRPYPQHTSAFQKRLNKCIPNEFGQIGKREQLISG